MLMVATDPRQIAEARALLIRQLTQGATIERRTLVWPGPERKIVNAGAKMHRFSGEKIHQ
jgi:hypothetical protein